MATIFGGKELIGVRRESPTVRSFPLEEAFTIMEGRMSGPEAAFGITPEYKPLVISEKELLERAKQGYDLVHTVGTDQNGNPLTMRRMHEIFSERHGDKGKLLYNLPEEAFLTEEVPQTGWRFMKAVEKGSTSKDYLEQMELLVKNAEQENPSPAFSETGARFRNAKNSLKKLIGTNYKKFLEALGATGIESHLVPSASEQLFHQAAVLAERGERPLRNVYARNSSRSSEFPGSVAFLGSINEDGAIVVWWNRDNRSSFLGVSSLRSIES